MTSGGMEMANDKWGKEKWGMGNETWIVNEWRMVV